MRVLVIIPAYNEEAAILRTLQDLRTHAPEADPLVINDCSADRTRELLIENGIPHIDLPLNLGIGGGVQTGYRYALAHGYDAAVQFDGDGQHCAEDMGALLQPLADGEADMVIGSRFAGQSEGFRSTAMRRAGIRLLSALIRLCTGKTIHDVTSGYRAVNRKLIQLFAEDYAEDYPEPEAIVTALIRGYRVAEVPAQMRERQGGESSIRKGRSLYYMIKVSLAILIRGVQLTGRERGPRGE